MTRVKICSVQKAEHIIAAAEAGADFVGLNFVPGVRRQLSEGKAKRMIQEYWDKHKSGDPRLVGIFVDQPLDDVNRILEYCDLDMAQLSGQEPLDYCLHVERPVIKAVHVPVGQPVGLIANTLDAVLAELEAAGILPLLDPEVAEGHGGTGQAFDWAVAQELASRHLLLLAGGLTPENVGRAVRKVRPWGVDVSSGVESGGIKAPGRIARFVREARTAEEQL